MFVVQGVIEVIAPILPYHHNKWGNTMDLDLADLAKVRSQ